MIKCFSNVVGGAFSIQKEKIVEKSNDYSK
jgi:hypothetical protein